MKTSLFLCTVFVGLSFAQKPDKCPQFCDAESCPDVASLNCIAEDVQDSCGCCRECAKVLGEQCGGDFWKLGKCGADYICADSPSSTMEVNVYENEVGICQCRESDTRVCGDDNVLYSNKCALQEASKRSEMAGRRSIEEARDSDTCQYAPIINTPPKNIKVNAGQQVYLSCEVEGNPIPDVVWYRDGKKMPDYHNNVVVQVRGGPGKHRETSWVMIDTTEEDSGTYRCVATNTGGEADEEARVRITPRPVAPEERGDTLV